MPVSSSELTQAFNSSRGERIKSALRETFQDNSARVVEVHGDVNVTIAADSHAIHLWSTTLTANRTATIATAGATAGSELRLTRTAGGAFTLTVNTSIVIATDQWVDLVYNGTAWVVTARGSLATS